MILNTELTILFSADSVPSATEMTYICVHRQTYDGTEMVVHHRLVRSWTIRASKVTTFGTINIVACFMHMYALLKQARLSSCTGWCDVNSKNRCCAQH